MLWISALDAGLSVSLNKLHIGVNAAPSFSGTMLLSSLFEVISNVLLQGGSGTDFPDNVNVAEAVDATTEMAKGMDKVVAIPLVCIPVGSNSLLMLPFFILQPLSNKFLVLRCVTPLPSLSCFQRAPGAAFFACQVGSTILLVALSNNRFACFLIRCLTLRS